MMISLEQTLKDQDDLKALCDDRELITSECFSGNAYYGIDKIIKKVISFPSNYSLKGIFPHGIVFNEDHVWEYEKNIKIPGVFSYPDYRDRQYSANTKKIIVKASSPYLYVADLLKKHPKPKRKGLIFFPLHSTHFVTVEQNYERMAIELCRFGKEFYPITVCLYWKDYNSGHATPFEQKGFRVVSAGHMFDQNFLFRLHHLCSINKYAASNGLGSSLFYSVMSGCSFFFLESGKIHYSGNVDNLQNDHPQTPEHVEKMARQLFHHPHLSITNEQIQFVNYYLGTHRKISPIKLRFWLILFEVLDKTGYFIKQNNKKLPNWSLSPFIRRHVNI